MTHDGGVRVNDEKLRDLWIMGNCRMSFSNFKTLVISALEPAIAQETVATDEMVERAKSALAGTGKGTHHSERHIRTIIEAALVFAPAEHARALELLSEAEKQISHHGSPAGGLADLINDFLLASDRRAAAGPKPHTREGVKGAVGKLTC